ncbi:MAG: hypothetical protein MR013_06295 [Prevotella sp.]|nr:hypothetical protein [Prevotella sp.]
MKGGRGGKERKEEEREGEKRRNLKRREERRRRREGRIGDAFGSFFAGYGAEVLTEGNFFVIFADKI